MTERGYPTLNLNAVIEPPRAGFWGTDERTADTRTAVRIVRNGDVAKDGYILRSSLPVRWVNDRERDAAITSDSDCILVSSGAYTGVTGKVLDDTADDLPVIVSNFVRRVRPLEGIDPAWLFHSLRSTSVQAQVWPHTGGSAMPNLNRSFFEHCVLPAPKLAVQRRIAEILDTVDGAILGTERLIAKLEHVKRGVLDDLLTRGVNDSGALRDRLRHPEHFTDTPLGSLPRDWVIQPCGDLCREIVVGIVIRPTQWYAPSGVPVLRSANVREDGIDMSNLMFMTAAHHRVLSKSAVSAGDVVTVRTGYPGTTAVIPESVAEANCVDIIISRPGPRLLPQYLSTWVNAPIGKGQVLAKQGGLAQQHFNVGEMKELLVAVPPLAEQRAICACTATLERQVTAERGLLSKLMTLKTGLMDDLLTGGVRVALDEDAA